MENTNIVVANTQLLDNSQKTPAEIVIEIKRYLHKTSDNIIQIGHLLLEAKKQIPHGDWGDWLIRNIDFSQNTANRFMRCALVFSNYAPAHNLNQTQMFELLALPSKKIKEFIEIQADSNSPVDSMSKNDLRAAIKSWKSDHLKTPSQTVTSSAHSLKNLEKFFALSSAVASVDNLDSLFAQYFNDDPNQVTIYIENLDKIKQSLLSIRS